MTGDMQWRGLPKVAGDGMTIPARRDEIEINLLTLLDVLNAHASHVGAGGSALIMATLLTPPNGAWNRIALLEESADDSEKQEGWRIASARAHQPGEEAVLVPAVHRVRLADMRDSKMRVRGAHHLAADLLSIFGVDQPAMLTSGIQLPAGDQHFFVGSGCWPAGLRPVARGGMHLLGAADSGCPG